MTDCRSWRALYGLRAGQEIEDWAYVRDIAQGAREVADITYKVRRGQKRWAAEALANMMSRLSHKQQLEAERTPANTDAVLLLQGRVSRKTEKVLERAYGTDFTGTWAQAVNMTALMAAA